VYLRCRFYVSALCSRSAFAADSVAEPGHRSNRPKPLNIGRCASRRRRRIDSEMDMVITHLVYAGGKSAEEGAFLPEFAPDIQLTNTVKAG
jgi:hypothetical protein